LGRRNFEVTDDPCRLHSSAKSRPTRLNEALLVWLLMTNRAARGLSIPLTAPADRLAAEGVGGRLALTPDRQRGFYRMDFLWNCLFG
jgi:hypothetical protein